MKSSKTPSWLQLAFHLSLFCAIATKCSKLSWGGASINRLPGRSIECCTRNACLTSLWSPIRKMCPSQRYLHFRTAYTRSYVRVRGLASMCAVRPVIRDRHLALNPFIFAWISSVRSHVSAPYTIREHTATLYIVSLSDRGIAGELKMCDRSPHLDIAIPSLLLRSRMWLPLLVKIEPR